MTGNRIVATASIDDTAIDITDGYCHCGLSKWRPVEDVDRVMDRFNVPRAVLAQHLGEFDNTYIEQTVAARPDRFAGVFLVDTEAADARDALEHWAGKGVFRGIRLLARSLDTNPGVWDDAVRLGLNMIVCDESTLSPYVDSLRGFLADHPNARMVFSHFGLWTWFEPATSQSYDRVLSLADYPGTFLQVSGFHMFTDYPYDEVIPLVQRALDAFGPERLLYGSNYPVMNEDAIYGQEIDLVRDGQFGIPVDAVEQVMNRTARELWFD
jgi:L-fuconolactonase